MDAAIHIPQGFSLIHLSSTSSTNDVCLELAENGAPDGTVILADAQTNGRGRAGRQWYSKPGASLTFSLLIRPTPEEKSCISRFTALSCLALIQVLEQGYAIQAAAKWPNDVLIHNRKIAGTLAETVWEGGSPCAIALGMGVNLAEEGLPASELLRFPAISLDALTDERMEPIYLLGLLLDRMQALRRNLCKEAFMQTWNTNLALKGEWVRLDQTQCEPLQVRIVGVDNESALIVEDRSGKVQKIYSGEISI